MANYVDRDLLLKVLTHRVKGNEGHHIIRGTNNTLALVEEWVRSVSIIDAVEVIRCHNCQYHEPCKVRGKVWCTEMGKYMKQDGFCSEGVVRDG